MTKRFAHIRTLLRRVYRNSDAQRSATVNATEFQQLLNELQAEGWTNYINHLDVQTVQEVSKEYGCENCGEHHIHAVGVIKGRPQDHYRCFAVCDDCGFVGEF